MLASSLVNSGGVLVLRGALVVPSFACLNSPNGWVGFGLPRTQGIVGMIGANVFITHLDTRAPTGA